MSHKLKIYFSDGSNEVFDEDFDTIESAEMEYDSWLENWSEGAEVLMFAGEDYNDADIIDYEIWKE